MAEAVSPESWGAVPTAPAGNPADWGAKQISAVGALGEGLKSGVTAGFSDELTGLYHASGIPKLLDGLDPKARTSVVGSLMSMLAGGARLGMEKLSGQPGEATQSYEQHRDEARATQKAAQEQYPKTFLAGQAGGAIAMPGGAMLQGATLPARMARGAAVGAGYAGASGFGEGEGLADSATRAVSQAPVGAVVGGLAPPLVEGAIQGARAVARPLIDSVRGAFRPGDEAGRRVVTALERDMRSDPGATTRLTPQEFVSNVQEGGPATVMDMGGGLTRRLADVSAITSPEGATALNRTLNDRFEGQGGRITDWLRGAFHYPDAHAQQQAIEQTARTVNRAGYARAHHDPAAQSLWDEGFEQIMQAPVVQDAARGATRTGANRAAADGFTPVRNPFEFHDTGSLTPRYSQRTDDQGRTILPNLEFWDHVKRNLDDKISGMLRSGENAAARDAQQLRSALISHLDELVPAYAQARAGAAHFFGAENALEAGQNFVGASQRYGIPEARQALGRMSPQERQLFQDGYVSRFVEKLDATGDRRNVLNQIAKSPAARSELVLALGPRRAQELEARLRIEGVMDLARPAVQGNSWTARRLYDLGLMGGGLETLHGGINQDPTELTIGAVMAALSSGGKRIDANVARHVAQLLVSQNANSLARGVQIVARNNRFMNALRATDQRLARIGGQQAPGVPAMQAAGVGRADQNQEQVPGPQR